MRVPGAHPDRVPREGETIFSSGFKPDYKINPETGCWEWQKSKLRGYGIGGKGKTRYAHRLYYERAFGPIPEGHDIHHRCGTTSCVNPEHLELAHNRAHDVENFLMRRGRDLEFVRQVREEGRQVGASAREVAARYGVDHQTVKNWWSSRHWADLLSDGPVITPGHVCHLDGCDNVCQGNRNKRYCCAAHRAKAGHRKRRAA